MNTDTMMNTEQVAQMLCSIFGVERRTVVERWMKSPDFPSPAIVVSSRAKAWKRSQIEAYLSRDAIDSADSR
jgi:predicted DNA-binding transcriptional regulator AlpA